MFPDTSVTYVPERSVQLSRSTHMPRKSSVRRSTSRPEPGHELTTLYQYFAHCELMHAVYKHIRHRVGSGESLDTVLSGGGPYAFPLWSAMTLHLATLYTVVEGWNRVRPGDPEIDHLTATDFVPRLRDFRHGVVHFGAQGTSPAITEAFMDHDMIEWTAMLHVSLRRFFAARFPGATGIGSIGLAMAEPGQS